MMKRSWGEANGSRSTADSNHPVGGSSHMSDFSEQAQSLSEQQPPSQFPRTVSFVPTGTGSDSHSQQQSRLDEGDDSASPRSSAAARPHSSPPARNLAAPRTTGRVKMTPTQELLPSISRKVKACAACRKQKIKCNMENDEPPCVRCSQRGLSCVLNKSLQSLLSETRQAQTTQVDLMNIYDKLVEVCQHLDMGLPLPLQTSGLGQSKMHIEKEPPSGDEDEEHDTWAASRPMSPSDRAAPIDAFLDTASKLDSPMSAAVESPMGSAIFKKTPPEPNLISKGIISQATAEHLVNRYLERLDHYLYGIGSVHNDFKTIRRASPILLAAVCTISALHEQQDSKIYEACSQEFQHLVSKSLFEDRGVEFLRALCIGSYWLSDASRILNGDALRRAADVRLQKYFYQVTVPDANSAFSSGDLPQEAKVDRVRIWYLLYICDQHLSILYNRDPIVHGDQDVILGWESFLESGQTNDSDIRIVSQVSLLQTMSQVRVAFGSEGAEPLSKALATSVNNYNRQIDQWFMRFSSSFKPNPHIGDFPHKGLTLHYHFAKLYLGHHVFRGLKAEPIPPYFLPAALMAQGAAISIFDFIINDQVLKNSLIGVPFYFHVMISFAGHFLLSCTQYSKQLSLDIDSNLGLIEKAIAIFRTLVCIPHHPLHKMTAALERRLFECTAALNRGYANQNSMNTLGNATPGNPQWSSNGNQTTKNESMFAGKSLGMAGDMMATPANSAIEGGAMFGGNPSNGMEGYSMVAPNADSSIDMVFQDFGQFDFRDMQMNFLP